MMRGAMLIAELLAVAAVSMTRAETVLPIGSAPRPLTFPHFPDRMHTFIWRNWTVVEPERIAKVLGTSVENVRAVAESMGLPPAPPIPPEMRTRGYITILKRNWHLLPYEQLLTLLDMSAEQLAHSLREDDFLIHKLGALKPACEPLKYAAPDEAARRRAAEIRRIVRETFGDEIDQPAEPRFGFVQKLSRPEPKETVPISPGESPPSDSARKRTGPVSPRNVDSPPLRYIYSYFAMYGDPLMTPELDPFPDGLLQRLADLGINGVWMHVVLRQLAPSETFPEFGAGSETRLANLRKLVERARRYGIRIYLYVNEPRAMQAPFFEKRPRMKGVQEGEYYALCTSDPQVRAWITDSLAHMFSTVPDLGGVFTITASENLTNCASHYQEAQCPRCRNRKPAEIIAEVNAAIEAGVHRGNRDAKVICWDWGWQDAWAPDVV
ncbi:MAG: alpha-amylase family protein, partial [Phycisphaerae bacterium]